MCEFCVQHGAGKKWYLPAKSYADELSRSEGRESFIKNIFKDYRKMYGRKVRIANVASSIPSVRKYALMKFNEYFSKDHEGHVVPLEDAVFICSIPEGSVL